MQKMSNGDYFDEKMRRGDRSKEARRISPPLKLLLKSPKLRGSTAPKSAHLHRGREQGEVSGLPWYTCQVFFEPCFSSLFVGEEPYGRSGEVLLDADGSGKMTTTHRSLR